LVGEATKKQYENSLIEYFQKNTLLPLSFTNNPVLFIFEIEIRIRDILLFKENLSI